MSERSCYSNGAKEKQKKKEQILTFFIAAVANASLAGV